MIRSSIAIRRHKRDAATAKRGLEEEIGARGETEHALLESDAAFIEKPFTLEALLSKVRETLGAAS